MGKKSQDQVKAFSFFLTQVAKVRKFPLYSCLCNVHVAQKHALEKRERKYFHSRLACACCARNSCGRVCLKLHSWIYLYSYFWHDKLYRFVAVHTDPF